MGNALEGLGIKFGELELSPPRGTEEEGGDRGEGRSGLQRCADGSFDGGQ